MVWLVRNLKLEVTRYLKDLYGPRGQAYPSDDDDDDDANDDDDDGDGDGGEDSKATLVTDQGRGTSGDPYRQTYIHIHTTYHSISFSFCYFFIIFYF